MCKIAANSVKRVGRAQVPQKSEEYNSNIKSANWTSRRLLNSLNRLIPE